MTESRTNGTIAAGIEFFFGRTGLMMLTLATATIACAVVMLVGLPGAPVHKADASSVVYSRISGKLTSQGRVVSGGGVYLYRWNGSTWVYLGKKATSNQYGYYAISAIHSGYYYKVMASKAYGICQSNSGQAIYVGSSQPLDLRNPSSSYTTVNIPLYFHHWYHCQQINLY